MRWTGLAGGLGLGLLAVWAIADGEPPTGFIVQSSVDDGLRTPTDVAWWGDDLLVADPSAGSVTRFAASGEAVWRTPLAQPPQGLVVEGTQVWVAAGAGLVSLHGETGVPGRRIALPEGTMATDVAPGSHGRLWASAAASDVLVLMEPDGTVVANIGGLMGPRGLTSDGQGGVWAAEAAGGWLVHVDAAGTIVGESGGWGLEAGEFIAPKGIALTADGGLAVTDSHQGIVVLLDAAGAFRRVVEDGEGPIPLVHPMGIASDGERLAVADAAGTVFVLAPSGAAHQGGAWPARFWLFRPDTVRDPDPSTTCRQCHDGTRTLALRVWDASTEQHPREPGPRAEVPTTVPVGPDGELRCSSCHALHARDPEASTHDPMVLRGAEVLPADSGPVAVGCADCHAAAMSRTASANDVGHPVNDEVPCGRCHAMHGARYPALSVAPIDDGTLCIGCHTDQAPARSHHPVGQVADPAAIRAITALGGRLGPGDTVSCLSCHDPHGARERHLLRASGTQDACTGCHAGIGRHAEASCASCHGMHEALTQSGAPRPCRACHDETTRHRGESGCRDCHAPHAPAAADCASCHEGVAAAVAGGPHDAQVHPVRGARDACGGCHAAHGGDGAYMFADLGSGNPAIARCMACHDGSTGATAVVNYRHATDVLLVGPPATGRDGEPVRAGVLGEITCRTCHDSHAPAERANVVGFCAGCHGSDAQGLYDGFHDERTR